MRSSGLLTFAVVAHGVEVSPIAKVISMLGELETKIIGEGETAQKTYSEFAEYCEERSRNVGFEIKTGKAQVEDLNAKIGEEAATISASETKIEELASSLQTDEADLKAATEIRTKEFEVFSQAEAELKETIDTLERAVGIIEKELKGGASMVQLKKATSVVEALEVMVKASGVSSADGQKLTALVQQSQQSDDDDSDYGAPDPEAYKSQSGGVLDVLNDLLEKATSQLDTTRNQETADAQNFEMLKQSLTDEIKFANKEMDATKKTKAAAQEGKATAEGDLEVTSKDLKEDIETLGGLHHDCVTKAEDFEAETKSRAEELKALATAKKIIKEAVSGAAFDEVSFLQFHSDTGTGISSRADLVNFEVVRFVRDLAKKQNSQALAQLASRMASTVRFNGGNQADIFAKIKGLIGDMIEKLEEDAKGDATQKAYCDKELAETRAKKEEKSTDIEKLTTKIDSASSNSKKLKEEVATLQKELAQLTRSQAEMDQVRAAEHSEFVANKDEMEKGLDGVKLALKVLNEYYSKQDKAHSASDGASSGIIGLLEVVESDFSKGLSEMISTEETSQSEYDSETKQNEISKAMKEQDVKYKSGEATGLDKSVAEMSSDKEGVQTELSAVLEYLASLEKQCIAKPESYSERRARREAEISGLKEAMSILDSETAFLQTNKNLRGVKKH